MTKNRITMILSVAAVALLGFTATAFAQSTSPSGEPWSVWDVLRPVVEAFRGKDYDAAGALALVALTAILGHYGSKLPGKFGAFFNGEPGKLVTLVGGAFFASLALQLTGPQGFTLGILKTAGWLAFLAGGGYGLVKKFLYPILVGKLRPKLPGWAQPILDGLLWFLDRGKAAAIAKAEKAGAAAVAAKPGAGAAGVVGKPRDVE